MLEDGIKRIILHWTGGGPTASAHDLAAYHYVVEQSGRVVTGDHAPAHNAAPLGVHYAKHVKGYNTGSLGVALAGMAGAIERPFKPGRFPITHDQVVAACEFVARQLSERGLGCSVYTVATHAEVELAPHSRPQRGKWDINWLPGLHAPVAPWEAGDTLRARIRQHIPGAHDPVTATKLIQLGLQGAGCDPGPIDGKRGPRTEAAARAWLGM